MRGLLTKSVHEVWLSTLLYGLALMIVKALLTFVLPQVQSGMGELLDQIPLARTMLSALLGTELGDEITARSMQAFLWVHPVVLALIWAHEISFCTRMPAGEIDRGTIDILLGWPVSRRTVYWCETLVWLVSGLLIICLGLVGHRLAAPAMPADMRPDLAGTVLVTLNLYGVYVAVGGIAFLVSALSDRRGRAMTVVFALVLASFLLNFVSQFWEPAQRIAFMSILEYYQPAQILQSGIFPAYDIAVLLGVGLTTWLLGGEVLARRSICTT